MNMIIGYTVSYFSFLTSAEFYTTKSQEKKLKTRQFSLELRFLNDTGLYWFIIIVISAYASGIKILMDVKLKWFLWYLKYISLDICQLILFSW